MTQLRVNQQRQVVNEQFAEQLKSANIECQLVDASDRTHGEVNKWFGRDDDQIVTGAAATFLEKHARRNTDKIQIKDQR